MTPFNPRIVDSHALALMRAKLRNDFAFSILCSILAAIIFIFGLPMAMGWMCVISATGNLGVAIVRDRRIRAIENEQSKTPAVYPPAHLQCSICGSFAADAIEYEGAGWREYFGYRVHASCESWVWPLWNPQRAIAQRRG